LFVSEPSNAWVGLAKDFNRMMNKENDQMMPKLWSKIGILVL